MDAIPRLHRNDADAFIFKRRPAFQHVVHLKFDIMHVPFGLGIVAIFGADHMGDDFAVRSVLHF